MRLAALLFTIFLLAATPAAAAVGDGDSDGRPDGSDNCSAVYNPGQEDSDTDLIGDACDPDIDGDGTPNGADAFPTNAAEQFDTDSDGTGDNTDTDDDNDGVLDTFPDNCRVNANASQANFDGDAAGDACDTDDDNDGAPDTSDAFPTNAAEQTDTDLDGVGNNSDNCPAIANASQTNIDHDTFGDLCDSDRDGDGAPDTTDQLPNDPTEQL